MPTIKAKVAAGKQSRQSGPALYSWRRKVGLNRGTFAGLANFSERTLATYERQQTLPPTIHPQINEAVRLVKALLEIIPAGDLHAWLHSPNPGFGGQKPWTLIRRGERDLVWRMIHQTQQGAFS